MPSAAHHLARKLLLILAAGLLSGCSTYRVQGPARISDPVQVYVLDYGRHASLALPAENHVWEEWFWGDWNWFAKGRTSVLSGFEALFASRGSALGRRQLPVPAESLSGAAGALEAHCIDVERARAEAMQRRLRARFTRGRRTTLVQHPDGREFVFDPVRYSLSHTSAHELGLWLRQLGVDVRGSSPTAEFRLATRCLPRS